MGPRLAQTHITTLERIQNKARFSVVQTLDLHEETMCSHYNSTWTCREPNSTQHSAHITLVSHTLQPTYQTRPIHNKPVHHLKLLPPNPQTHTHTSLYINSLLPSSRRSTLTRHLSQLSLLRCGHHPSLQAYQNRIRNTTIT